MEVDFYPVVKFKLLLVTVSRWLLGRRIREKRQEASRFGIGKQKIDLFFDRRIKGRHQKANGFCNAKTADCYCLTVGYNATMKWLKRPCPCSPLSRISSEKCLDSFDPCRPDNVSLDRRTQRSGQRRQ
ncbi:hypothetical protein M513_00905 [Trichuris suis]|uniref:Uncharacterized protein n=1 Tax=Trichuris suis TaxID=68888 RepID=A0A085MLP6_9BILA|nr:hypothetical protein M513_00905 [Trichuris suis]